MTFDPTKPVQTRDGRTARIIATDRKGSCYPIVALVSSSPCKEELIILYLANGREFDGLSVNDLVNIPDEREMWVNVYENNGNPDAVFIEGYYKSRAEADKGCGSSPYRIARLRIRFTVGQMDE